MTQPADAPIAVSVVIPSTRADLLSEQLRAVTDQVLDRPFEVIVVTDDPEGVVLPRGRVPVRLVREHERGGPSRARNLGAVQARGEVLAFCDDDDVVGEGWLAALVSALADAGAAAGRMDVGSLNDRATIEAYGFPLRQTALAMVAGWLPYGETSNLAVRRPAFEGVGGFEESMQTAEDRDLSVRLQLAGHALAFAPEAVVHRRLRPTPAGQLVQRYRWARGEALLFRRHRTAGMPRDGAGRAWLRLVRDAPHLARRRTRGAWAQRLAERIGRLAGSVRHRTWYP